MKTSDIWKKYELCPKLMEKLSEKKIISCDLTECDLHTTATVITLKELSLSDEEIVDFCTCDCTCQQTILRRTRENLLCQLHKCQKKIDTADKLLYQLGKK